MKLEQFKDKSGNIRYKLDKKYIYTKQAKAIIKDTSAGKYYSDSLTVINEVEAELQAQFIIDHTVKLDGGIFAKTENGATMELYDDRIVVKKVDGTETNYRLDIAETRYIAELQKVGETENFTITGDSGTSYTFNAKTFEVVGKETKSENLRDFIINNRRKAINDGKSEVKARAA